MAEVEALMVELACGMETDPVGRIVCEHLATGGKRLRARLALATLEALGGSRAEGFPWAAACELLHNATLVHDDLQDGDRVRRGHPTMWARHGLAQAINAGDLLLMLPFLAIAQLDAAPAVQATLSAVLARHATRVVRGQATELGLRSAERIDWDSYLRAVLGKTSALFQLPVEGAALLAGRTPGQAHALADCFRHLGVLFQLQDDVLDLYGDKGRGTAGSDLREGKISTLVVEHLALYPNDRDWLLTLLASPREETHDEAVNVAMCRFREGGALEKVLVRIEREALAVRNASSLDGCAEVGDLANELVAVALRPIDHLLETPTVRDRGVREVWERKGTSGVAAAPRWGDPAAGAAGDYVLHRENGR